MLKCTSNQDWKLLAVCMGVLSSWKSAWLLGNNTWTIGCIWLPKMSTQSLAVIRPFRVSTGPAEYYILLPKSSQICFHVAQLEPGIQDYRFSWVTSKHKPGLMLWTTWRMTHLTILCVFNHQMARFCDHHLLVLLSVIRGLATAAVPWMLDLWSSRQTLSVETIFKMNIKFCCHLCCSTSLIYRHNPFQCRAIPFT